MIRFQNKEDILSIFEIKKNLKKIHYYRTKRVQNDRQMRRVRLPNLIMKYQRFEKRSQGQPIKGLGSLIGTGTGQEAYIKNRCKFLN
jgi:hypothetical protein